MSSVISRCCVTSRYSALQCSIVSSSASVIIIITSIVTSRYSTSQCSIVSSSAGSVIGLTSRITSTYSTIQSSVVSISLCLSVLSSSGSSDNSSGIVECRISGVSSLCRTVQCDGRSRINNNQRTLCEGNIIVSSLSTVSLDNSILINIFGSQRKRTCNCCINRQCEHLTCLITFFQAFISIGACDFVSVLIQISNFITNLQSLYLSGDSKRTRTDSECSRNEYDLLITSRNTSSSNINVISANSLLVSTSQCYASNHIRRTDAIHTVVGVGVTSLLLNSSPTGISLTIVLALRQSSDVQFTTSDMEVTRHSLNSVVAPNSTACIISYCQYIYIITLILIRTCSCNTQSTILLSCGVCRGIGILHESNLSRRYFPCITFESRSCLDFYTTIANSCIFSRAIHLSNSAFSLLIHLLGIVGSNRDRTLGNGQSTINIVVVIVSILTCIRRNNGVSTNIIGTNTTITNSQSRSSNDIRTLNTYQLISNACS